MFSGICYSTRANLMGTSGLSRVAVDAAPNGDYNIVGLLVTSQHGAAIYLCIWKRQFMDHLRTTF